MGFALHPDTYKSVKLLKDGKPGDRYTEQEIEKQLGFACKPNTEGKLRVSKAIKICYRDHHVLWKWFKDKDTDERYIKVCSDQEVVTECDVERRRINRASVRLTRKSICADERQLNEETKRTYRALQVQAMMTERTTKTQMLKKMTENGHVLVAPELPQLLELMKK